MNHSQLIEDIEQEQLKTDIPEFRVGDTVSVHVRIIEGEKERVQVFTGVVIARKGGGLAETVSIYRVAYGSAMERVFPLHSPKVAKIEVIKHGKVRRGKLYHLRGLFGKKTKIKERIVAQPKKEKSAKEAVAPVEEKAEAPKEVTEPKTENKQAEEPNKE